MIKEDCDIVNRNLEMIIGSEMQKPTRDDSIVELEFKKLVEEQISKYALFVYSRFRFTYMYDIILTPDDIFVPSNKYLLEGNYTKDEFDEERFNEDWCVEGNNAFDEIIEKYFSNNEYKFIVKTASINRFGDLKIVFENGFIFETFSDMSHYYDCWGFLKIDSGKYLIISSEGLREETEEIQEILE